MSKLASVLSVVLALAGASVASAQGEGSISGTVKFEGTAKKPKKLNGSLDGDKFCGPARADQDVFAEDMIVAPETNTMANVLVYIKSGAPKGKAPDKAEVIDQSKCIYRPHVLVVQVGQTLTIKNSDDTMHNIHATPGLNKEFNEGQGKAGMTSDKQFTVPEIGIKVKCDVHAWMGAVLHVVEHPYWSLTKADGKFEIKGLPAGKYTVEAWQEKCAPKSVEITVGDKEAKTQDFSLKLP
ncbi:MAG TPA: carboxypeptidase regulatory-like domain-containing protein [Planctomycetota bacterium]|nr:carboxypeptidase regulatory-like domain-containing protein [Planctomycetota bacterium]